MKSRYLMIVVAASIMWSIAGCGSKSTRTARAKDMQDSEEIATEPRHDTAPKKEAGAAGAAAPQQVAAQPLTGQSVVPVPQVAAGKSGATATITADSGATVKSSTTVKTSTTKSTGVAAASANAGNPEAATAAAAPAAVPDNLPPLRLMSLPFESPTPEEAARTARMPQSASGFTPQEQELLRLQTASDQLKGNTSPAALKRRIDINQRLLADAKRGGGRLRDARPGDGRWGARQNELVQYLDAEIAADTLKLNPQ